MTQLWTAQILTHPAAAEYKQKSLLLDIMELEFKDGVAIQFGTERTESEEISSIDDWMASLEEVDMHLGTNPVPEWLSSCQ